MTFATPLIAGIAAAIAIPSLLILYFLKLRRQDVEISTTLLWRKAIQDLQANAPFQKLRRNILLLLQLLALAAALFALAQPQVVSSRTETTRHVFMIDRSASMAAIDGDEADPGKTRLEAAKDKVKDAIDALAEPGMLSMDSGDQAMVIAFDAGAAEVIQRFTGDKQQLKSAVDRIEQSDVPGAVGEAFRLAQAHRPRQTIMDDRGGTAESATALEIEGLVGGPPQTFHLFSDGRLPDLEVFAPAAQDSVVYHTVGRPDAANLAITGLRAERAYDEPNRLTIFVGIQNASARERTVDVELLLDGTPVSIRPVSIPAAESAGVAASGEDEDEEAAEARPRPGTGGVVFELERSDGAIATVRMRTGDLTARAQNPDADMLPTDDTGYLVIPPARQTGVAVVTSGNLYLAEALGGLPLARLDTFSPSAFEALSIDERSSYDVVVLDGVLPPGTPAGRALAPGRWLIFNAVPGSAEGLVDQGAAELSRLLSFVDWRRDHPILRGLTLDAIRMSTFRRVDVGPESIAEVLAETPAGPGIIELTTTDARAIVLPWNVADSNWPFDVSFVIFLASAIDHLGSDAAQRIVGAGERHLTPGEVYADRLPAGVSSATVSAPDGASTGLEAGTDGRVAFGPVRRTGVFEVEWVGEAAPGDVVDGNRARRFFAANLLDPFEADIGSMQKVAIGTEELTAEDGTTTAVRRYWPYLLMAFLAVMMLEWYIYNRKVYV